MKAALVDVRKVVFQPPVRIHQLLVIPASLFGPDMTSQFLPVVTSVSAGPTGWCLLTQLHVSGPGVTLLVTLATPQLHELYVQLIQDIPVQCIHRIHQLGGKAGQRQGE